MTEQRRLHGYVRHKAIHETNQADSGEVWIRKAVEEKYFMAPGLLQHFQKDEDSGPCLYTITVIYTSAAFFKLQCSSDPESPQRLALRSQVLPTSSHEKFNTTSGEQGGLKLSASSMNAPRPLPRPRVLVVIFHPSKHSQRL